MRFIPIRLFLLAGMLVLGACGGQSPTAPLPPDATRPVIPSQSPPPTETNLPQPSVATQPTATPDWLVPVEELRGRRLALLHPFSGELDAVLVGLASEFNSSNPWGLRVETQFSGGAAQVDEKLLAGNGADTLPDLAVGTAAQVLDWERLTGRRVDLFPFAQDAQFGLEGGLEDFTAALVKPVEQDGALLGLPLLTSPRLLFYNQSWAQELGFEQPPSTLDAFWEQSCAAARANQADGGVGNDGTGGWVVDSDALSMLSWLAAYGAEELAEPADFEYSFDQPAAVEAFSDLHNWLADDCIWLGRQTSGYDYFASRMALFISGQAEEIAVQQRAMDLAGRTDTWSVLPFPTEDGQPVVFAETQYLAVLSDDPQGQLGAWLFARWLSEPPQLARLAAVGGSLPSRQEALNAVLPELQGRLPQWTALPALMEFIRTPPARADWLLASRVLEDAGWYLFQPATLSEQVPEILEMLDETIREVGSRQDPATAE